MNAPGDLSLTHVEMTTSAPVGSPVARRNAEVEAVDPQV